MNEAQIAELPFRPSGAGFNIEAPAIFLPVDVALMDNDKHKWIATSVILNDPYEGTRSFRVVACRRDETDENNITWKANYKFQPFPGCVPSEFEREFKAFMERLKVEYPFIKKGTRHGTKETGFTFEWDAEDLRSDFKFPADEECLRICQFFVQFRTIHRELVWNYRRYDDLDDLGGRGTCLRRIASDLRPYACPGLFVVCPTIDDAPGLPEAVALTYSTGRTRFFSVKIGGYTEDPPSSTYFKLIHEDQWIHHYSDMLIEATNEEAPNGFKRGMLMLPPGVHLSDFTPPNVVDQVIPLMKAHIYSKNNTHGLEICKKKLHELTEETCYKRFIFLFPYYVELPYVPDDEPQEDTKKKASPTKGGKPKHKKSKKSDGKDDGPFVATV